MLSDSRDVGHSYFISDGCTNTGLGPSPNCTPVNKFMRESPRTPSRDVDAVHHLTDMVEQLGAQAGESIVAKLLSAGVVNMHSDNQNAFTTQNTHCDLTKHDHPHVTVHVKSDRELQTNTTDKYSVQAWIDITKTHLRKHEITVH